jgi:hypothetical protein
MTQHIDEFADEVRVAITPEFTERPKAVRWNDLLYILHARNPGC